MSDIGKDERMILREKTSIDDLYENGNKFHADRVKFCIDKKRELVCIDGEMHIDMEYELIDDGSSPEDIFGGDFVFEGEEKKRTIVWEAHPNIERNRLLGIGQGRKLEDYNLINELTVILSCWLY